MKKRSFWKLCLGVIMTSLLFLASPSIVHAENPPDPPPSASTPTKELPRLDDCDLAAKDIKPGTEINPKCLWPSIHRVLNSYSGNCFKQAGLVSFGDPAMFRKALFSVPIMFEPGKLKDAMGKAFSPFLYLGAYMAVGKENVDGTWGMPKQRPLAAAPDDFDQTIWHETIHLVEYLFGDTATGKSDYFERHGHFFENVYKQMFRLARIEEISQDKKLGSKERNKKMGGMLKIVMRDYEDYVKQYYKGGPDWKDDRVDFSHKSGIRLWLEEVKEAYITGPCNVGMEAPFKIIRMAASQGDPSDKESGDGGKTRAWASIEVEDYSGGLSLEWIRLPDGAKETNNTIKVEANTTINPKVAFGEDRPGNAGIKDGIVELRVSPSPVEADSFPMMAKRRVAFGWDEDSNKKFYFTGEGEEKSREEFSFKEKVRVVGNWEISGNGDNRRSRSIIYYANDKEFARENNIKVTTGPWSHAALLNPGDVPAVQASSEKEETVKIRVTLKDDDSGKIIKALKDLKVKTPDLLWIEKKPVSQVIDLQEGTPPTFGWPTVAEAAVILRNYQGPLAVEWLRASDLAKPGGVWSFYIPPPGKWAEFAGKNKFATLIKQDDEGEGRKPLLRISLREEFPEDPPPEQRTEEDTVTLIVGDGGEMELRHYIDFQWGEEEETDEFTFFEFSDEKGEKNRNSYYPGETAVITSRWKLLPESGTSRDITYYSDGKQFAKEKGREVIPGEKFEHTAKLDLHGRKPYSEIKLRAVLRNTETKTKVSGEDSIQLMEGRDAIEKIWIVSGQPIPGYPRHFWWGAPLSIHVDIRAAPDREGKRKLVISGLGKKITHVTDSLRGAEGVRITLNVDTASLLPGKHCFRVKLLYKRKRQDRMKDKFTLVEIPPPPVPEQGEPIKEKEGGRGHEEGPGGGTPPQKQKEYEINFASYWVELSDKWEIRHLASFAGFDSPASDHGATYRITACGISMYVDGQAYAHAGRMSDTGLNKRVFTAATANCAKMKTNGSDNDALKAAGCTMGTLMSGLAAASGQSTPIRECGYKGPSKHDVELENLKKKQYQTAPPPRSPWMK